MVEYIPQGKVIVEVGVGTGGFSQCLIDHCNPSHFIAIDSFKLHELDSLWGQPIREWFGPKTHLEFYADKFADAISAGHLTILAGDSPGQIASLSDESVDVFYVDGDHTYEGVVRDLAAIRSKIKLSGLLILNDYTLSDGTHPYGVVPATHEFMTTYGYQMTALCLEPLMFCDVVLQQVGQVPFWTRDCTNRPGC